MMAPYGEENGGNAHSAFRWHILKRRRRGLFLSVHSGQKVSFLLRATEVTTQLSEVCVIPAVFVCSGYLIIHM